MMDDEIEAAFDIFPADVRGQLLMVRDLIGQAAKNSNKVGELVETLKWGQPSYLPRKPRIGSTVRIGTLKTSPDTVALFFHCQTRLVETFRHLYPDTFIFQGNRAMLVRPDGPVPEDEIRHCASLALTYHLWK
jgi:hypothetical protein